MATYGPITSANTDSFDSSILVLGGVNVLSETRGVGTATPIDSGPTPEELAAIAEAEAAAAAALAKLGGSLMNTDQPWIGPISYMAGDEDRSTPLNLTGGYMSDYGDILLNKIHVFPSVVDLGTMTTPTTATFTIWNTYPDAITVSNITKSNGDGIDISRDAGLFVTIPSMSSIEYTVSATMDGGPLINALYTLDFGDKQATVVVVGKRLMMFAFAADWSQQPVEILEYKTDIFEAYDGTEHRSMLRDDPRRHVQFQYTVEGDVRRQLTALQYELQAKKITIPNWLSDTWATVRQGDTSVTCDTTWLGLEAGDTAVLWQHAGLFDVKTVASISATSITFTDAVEAIFTGNVRVSKMNAYTMQDSVAVNYITDDLANLRPTLTADILDGLDWTDPLETSTSTTHNGIPVFDFKANRVEDLKFSFDRKIDYFETEVAAFQKIDMSTVPSIAQDVRVELDGKAEIKRMQSFINIVGGMHKPFYMPTNNSDLELAADVSYDTLTITIKNAGYTNYIKKGGQLKNIAIKTYSGEIYPLEILDSVEGLEGVEHLTVAAATNVDINMNDVDKVCFLNFSRFASDRFEFKYTTQEVATINLKTKSVKYDI